MVINECCSRDIHSYDLMITLITGGAANASRDVLKRPTLSEYSHLLPSADKRSSSPSPPSHNYHNNQSKPKTKKKVGKSSNNSNNNNDKMAISKLVKCGIAQGRNFAITKQGALLISGPGIITLITLIIFILMITLYWLRTILRMNELTSLMNIYTHSYR